MWRENVFSIENGNVKSNRKYPHKTSLWYSTQASGIVFFTVLFFFSSFIDRKQQNKDFTWYWNQHISKFDFEVLFYLKKEEKCWAIDTEITWWSWRGSNNNEEMKRWPKIWDNPQSIWKNCSSFVIERRKEWRTSVTMSTRSDDDSLRHHWYSNSKSTCRLICLYHRKKIQPRRFQSFLYGHDQQSSNPRCNIISMDSTAQHRTQCLFWADEIIFA